jgi:ABC-type nickel/cobalt efflux system permease component RcnA
MLVIGLLLVLGAAALTVGAVYGGSDPATVEILGRSVHTTLAGVFFTGAATALVFILGLWLLQSSMGRTRRRRAERKELKTRHRDSVARLEEERTALRAENERLSEELAHQRADTPVITPATAPAPASGRHADDRAATADYRDTTLTDTRPSTGTHDPFEDGHRRDGVR